MTSTHHRPLVQVLARLRDLEPMRFAALHANEAAYGAAPADSTYPGGLLLVEHACRSGCQERRWVWDQAAVGLDPVFTAHVWGWDPMGDGLLRPELGAARSRLSPAHAFALAYLAALEARRA